MHMQEPNQGYDLDTAVSLTRLQLMDGRVWHFQEAWLKYNASTGASAIYEDKSPYIYLWLCLLVWHMASIWENASEA